MSRVEAPARLATRGGQRYRVFGHNLESSFPFETPLATAEGAPDLALEWTRGGAAETIVGASNPVAGAWRAVYESPRRDDAGGGRVQLFTAPGVTLLRRRDVVDFYLRERRIDAHLVDEERAYLLDIGFFGVALPLWLESKGWPVLHASAVRVGERAIGFLASASGGKSSLAVAMMQAGASLVTDDSLALEEREGCWFVHPSFPQLRLWPEDADRVLGSVAGLRPSHPAVEKLRVPVHRGDDRGQGFGHFDSRAARLAALYLPERRTGAKAVEIAPLSEVSALRELLVGSANPELLEALGLRAARFQSLSALARTVAVRRLVLPSGHYRLAEVAQALVRDLEDLG